jgi:hypothetical protein
VSADVYSLTPIKPLSPKWIESTVLEELLKEHL